MDALLRPGMRLMRRLGVAGKFITIGLLLLVPLLVSVSGVWTAGSRDITSAQRERDGLRVAAPLVRLLAVLAEEQEEREERSAPATRDGSLQLQAALDDVDAAEAAVGARLGLYEGWRQLRDEVLGSQPARAMSLTQDYIERVADASNLILDQQLDSYYVMIALIDRLPRALVATAARDRALRIGLTGPSWRRDDPVLNEVSDRLRLDLAKAMESSDWDGLGRGIIATEVTFNAALEPYLSLPGGPAPAMRDLAKVTTAGAALADRLGQGLDMLLQERQNMRARQRLSPLLLAALTLACSGYLALALYRATTRDVQTVLTEINRVTSGEVDVGDPLPGRDEFAQMSRAIRSAGDRLTELLSALRLQATHDELTALPNRTMFMAKLEDAIADRPGRCAVVLADLERFKDVNDSFGHDMGDRLLRVVSARFHKAVGRRNLVARLGGNEFAVLVHDAPRIRDAQQVVARMQVALSEPVDIDGRQLHVRARMGIALHTTGRPGGVELIRNADVALSAAKGRDGDVVTLFEPIMHERTRDRTELSGDLVTAVAQQQFSLVYQPIVDVTTGTVQGVEALVRWVHPTRGPVSPAVFIPLAEASGQIVDLGRWVLHESLRQLAAWHREFPDGYPLTMDVNLSADQLADVGLPADVLAMVSRTGVDPRRVVLEITETALVRDTETVLRRLGQLSAIGVRLALDDFGTGYSSLSYLRRLPVSVLKVDKSFVDDIDDADGQAARLLHDIVGLGNGLGMEVIAEGIESPAQLPVLRSAGCHLGQGYLWSRPITAEQVSALLRDGATLPAQHLPPQRPTAGPADDAGRLRGSPTGAGTTPPSERPAPTGATT
jgi:diguanylate cyclase (GGDEF)-like protein